MELDSASTRPFKHELIRKLLHLPALAFPALAFVSRPLAIAFLVLLALLYASAAKFSASVPKIFNTIIDYCRRERDFDPAPAYLALGLALAIAIGPTEKAFFAAYVIAISDSLAALVGRKYGHHPIGNLKKSWQGSAVFLVATWLGAYFFLSPIQAAQAAVLLTLAEMLCGFGTDNLVLPVIAQMLVRFL
jgi:dolichol kinase